MRVLMDALKFLQEADAKIQLETNTAHRQ